MTVTPDPLDFTGKSILVTGGGAGIGRACAEAYSAYFQQFFDAAGSPIRVAPDPAEVAQFGG